MLKQCFEYANLMLIIYIYIKEFYWQNGDLILMNFGKKNLDLI